MEYTLTEFEEWVTETVHAGKIAVYDMECLNLIIKEFKESKKEDSP